MLINADPETKSIFEFGPFRLDEEEHLLLHDECPVAIKPKVFELLCLLVRNAGHLLSKATLMETLWPNSVVEEHNLTVAVSELRRALGDSKGRTYTQTVPRLGYRFTAPVRKIKSRASSLVNKKSSLESVPAPLTADESYLKGRFLFNKKTPPALKKALRYFKEAIRRNPSDALPYVAIAETYIYLFEFNSLPASKAIGSAKKYLSLAYKIDKVAPEIHVLRGLLTSVYGWDWGAAEIHYRRALEFNPNSPSAHQQYAVFLRHVGRFEEALSEMKLARDLDPVSLSIGTGVGTVFYFFRQYATAIKELQGVLELDAGFPVTHYVLGLCYEQQGRYNKAITEYELADRLLDGKDSELKASLARTLALSGAIAEARELLGGLTSAQSCSPYYVAQIQLALRNQKGAMDLLEECYVRRDHTLSLIKTDPRLDAVRGEPRFLSLLKRVHSAG